MTDRRNLIFLLRPWEIESVPLGFSQSQWLRLSPEKRTAEKNYYKASVKLLRRYVKEFGSSDGYDLTDVRKLHPSRIAKIKRLAPYFREIQGSPHVEVRARVPASIRTLRTRTKQSVKGQKTWLVHVDRPELTTVKVRHGILRQERRIRGGKITEEIYYLPEVAVSFDHIADMLESEMLADMPKKGRFVVETETHGPVAIEAPIPHGTLVKTMRRQWSEYDARDLRLGHAPFAPSVLGFRMVAASMDDADKWVQQKQTEREVYREHRERMLDEELQRTRSRMPRLTRSELVKGRRGRVR